MDKDELKESLQKRIVKLRHTRFSRGAEFDQYYHDGLADAYESCLDLIDQLDEPEKIVVPEFVGEYIQECKAPVKQASGKKSLYAALDSMPKKVSEWLLFDVKEFGQDIFARAWLDGYTVEEKKYRVVIGHYVLRKWNNSDTFQMILKNSPKENNLSGCKIELTEKEIKAIWDERFWPFAEEVTG